MTRIGIDYTSAVRQGAGIGRYTRGLVRALAERDGTNQYVLFSAGCPAEANWPPNFSLRSLPLTDRHLAIIWQRLRLPLPVDLLTGRIDIYHSPDFVLPPVRRAKTVLTVHDLSFLRYPQCSSAPLLAYLMDAVPRSVRRADVILADSRSTQEDLVELLGVDPGRIRVVHAGVEERFVPLEDETEAKRVSGRYGITRPFILGLGTLQPRKNFVRLIRAYALLRQRYDLPHQLVIGGGRGWLYEEIDDAIRSLHLEGDVLLIGFVGDSDLPALYRAADVFAFPSLYEGFGLPVLEAMGCGTPVVTSAVSSLPEVAGDAALLIDPRDESALAEAMARVYRDPTLRQEMVERGRGRVGAFSWRRCAEKVLEALEAVGTEDEHGR